MLWRLTYSDSKINDSHDSTNLFSTGAIDSSGIQPSLLQGADKFNKMKRFENHPVRLLDPTHIAVLFCPPEIILCLFRHVDTCNPT